MQRLKQWLKRFLLWIGAAALLLGAAACGRANGAQYSMPTDVERLFTTAAQLEDSASAASGYDLPGANYLWQYTSEDGNLTISADAVVRVPAGALSMVHVTGGGFTQAQVTGVFHYLFAGRAVTTTLGQNVQTKAVVQEQLDQMNRTLEDGTYEDYGFTKEEYEEAVLRQEAVLQNAPDASAGERIATDGTLLTVLDDEGGSHQALLAQTETLDSFDVSSYPADDLSRLPSRCYYERYDAPVYSMLDAVAVQEGDALPGAASGKLTRSYEEAKTLSDGLFASAGVDVSLLAAYVVGDRQTGDTDGVVQDAAHYAYEFLYTRTVGGIPVAADVWADDGGAEGIPWEYEQIRVIVDDEGIAQLRWSEPVTPRDDSTACASILGFPQAQEIFEKMAPLVYGAQTASANPKLDYIRIGIDLSEVQLCLLRVKDQTAESKIGLLVPAWVFYGDIVSQTFWKDGSSCDPSYRQGMDGAIGCDFSPGPTIVLAVNAVDGSVIDVSLGY